MKWVCVCKELTLLCWSHVSPLWPFHFPLVKYCILGIMLYTGHRKCVSTICVSSSCPGQATPARWNWKIGRGMEISSENVRNPEPLVLCALQDSRVKVRASEFFSSSQFVSVMKYWLPLKKPQEPRINLFFYFLIGSSVLLDIQGMIPRKLGMNMAN